MKNQSKEQFLPDPSEIQPVIVAKPDFYCEGPCVDQQGNIYFSNLQGGFITRIDLEGKQHSWAKATCPNGQRVMQTGEHLVCDSLDASIKRFDPQGNFVERSAQGKCEDLEIRVPNDLIIDHQHGFYFTDSVRHTGAVYFFGFDGSSRVMARSIDYANGIALSSDRTKLYVAESYRNRILTLDLNDPGVPEGKPEVFADLPRNENKSETGNLPDGIAFDTEGRLWVAHYGMQSLQVLSSTGDLLATYDTGIPLTSNLCFAGENRSSVFVTGGLGEPKPGLFTRLDVGVTGLDLLE